MQTYDLPSRTATPRRLSVVTCSLCLRVQRDSSWIEADEAIRELRTYELPEPVLLAPGLCDRCSAEIQARREAA